MKIITDNIEKECWDILSLYEDIEYVKETIKLIKPRIKQTTLNKVASEINLYIKQANELYNSSNSIITGPLTLFYSLNNLVRAVYLLNNPTKGIKGSHGLSLNSLDGQYYKLNEISVHIEQSGTFNNLNELLNYNLPENIDISMKDLLCCIPELSSIYNLVYCKEPNVYLMCKNLDKSYEYKVILPNNNLEEIEGKNFTLLENNHVQINFFSNALGSHCMVHTTIATENFNNVIEKDIFNNLYLTLGTLIQDKTIKIAQLNAIYILFYVFSMELRYRAYEWINIINSKEKAIIKKSIEELKVKMLVCILSLLKNDNIEFIKKIDNYKEDISYSKLTDRILKEIEFKNKQYGKSVLENLI